MSTKKNYRFETLQLHVGQEQADPTTDARAVPIYQTTSYVFRNSQHAADRFALKDAGNIYGRLTNPTQGVLEERIAALEGGVAALAVASGAAAVTYALQNIVQAGDHVVAADNLYGGSFNLITHTLATQGITNSIVNVNDLAALEAAIQPNTKVSHAETCGNPNSCVAQLIARLRGDQEFPHEVGLFLGYPPADVDGFMHRKEEYKLCGLWKVYDDVEGAVRQFTRCKRCTEVYLNCLSRGFSLDRLTVAG